MLFYLKNKGQGTLEYAIIIAVIVAALIAMQTYVKRGVEGRVRESSDNIGEQYSPGHTSSNKTVNTNSDYTTDTNNATSGDGQTKTKFTSAGTNYRNATGTETVEGLGNENWPK